MCCGSGLLHCRSVLVRPADRAAALSPGGSAGTLQAGPPSSPPSLSAETALLGAATEDPIPAARFAPRARLRCGAALADGKGQPVRSARESLWRYSGRPPTGRPIRDKFSRSFASLRALRLKSQASTSGWALQHAGDRDAALVELEIAAKLAPHWDAPVIQLASALHAAGRDTEALSRVEHHAADPRRRTPALLFCLASCCERMRDPDGAIQAYEELLNREPQHALALNSLAHLTFVSGKKGGAALADPQAPPSYSAAFSRGTASALGNQDRYAPRGFAVTTRRAAGSKSSFVGKGRMVDGGGFFCELAKRQLDDGGSRLVRVFEKLE